MRVPDHAARRGAAVTIAAVLVLAIGVFVGCGGDDPPAMTIRPLKPQDRIDMIVNTPWTVTVELSRIPSQDTYVDIDWSSLSEYVKFDQDFIKFFQSDESVEKTATFTALKETPGIDPIKIRFSLRGGTSSRELAVRITSN